MKTAYAWILASLSLVACGGEASDGAGEEDVTAGREVAKLIPKTYKQTKTVDGAKCKYDISYLSVLAPAGSPSSPSVVIGKFLNAALYYGEQNPENECVEPITVTGGYKQASVNAGYVLSVLYSFQTSFEGIEGEYIRAINLNLSTGKPITLAEVLTNAGKEKLIASCNKQLTVSMAEMQVPASESLASACKDAVTFGDLHTREDFTIEKTGLRVHIDSQLPHMMMALAGDGFLVKWADLGTGLKAGSPVKALAGR